MKTPQKLRSTAFYFLAILIIAATLTAKIVLAQDAAESALTVDQAITEARGKSPELKRAQAADEESSWRPLDAISTNLPQVRLTANHLFDAKFQVLDVASPTGTTQFPLVAPESLLTLGVYWTIFDGLKGYHNFQAAKTIRRASDLELDRAAFTLDEQVRQRFYQALGAQILADVAQQNVMTLQDHMQKTKEILNRGSATRFDLLRVQVQLEEALSDKAGADDNVILARKNLAVVMGQEDDQRHLNGELPVPVEAVINANLKPDFSARTDIEAIRQRADAATDAHRAAYGNWIPSISLSAEKQYYDNTDYSLFGRYRDAYAIGMQLTWNLFDGGASIARFKQTQYQAQQAQAAAESASLRAPQEFETFKRRYIYNASLYRAKRRAVEFAQESVRLARLGFGAGTRTSTDILDAELDLIRARAGVIRAQVDGVDALINLELALGTRFGSTPATQTR